MLGPYRFLSANCVLSIVINKRIYTMMMWWMTKFGGTICISVPHFKFWVHLPPPQSYTSMPVMSNAARRW